MPKVICYSCGIAYYPSFGSKDITKLCPECYKDEADNWRYISHTKGYRRSYRWFW